MADDRRGGFLRHWLERWPAYQDLREFRQGRRFDQLGLGDTAISNHTRGMEPRTRSADKVSPSICPYCAVGCGQLVYVRDGKIIDIEGNPHSPINGGTLCPKGAATYQLAVNPNRITRVWYRAPGATDWDKTKTLDWAMDRIAHLVKQTRDETWEDEDPKGNVVNRTLGIAHLGGATLDNEENYLIKKLFTALGIVQVENQARI